MTCANIGLSRRKISAELTEVAPRWCSLGTARLREYSVITHRLPASLHLLIITGLRRCHYYWICQVLHCQMLVSSIKRFRPP